MKKRLYKIRCRGLLTSDGGRTQLNVVGATPGLEVLGSVRKQAEKAIGRKPVSSAQCSSMASMSSPISGVCPVSVPNFTAFDDELL